MPSFPVRAGALGRAVALGLILCFASTNPGVARQSPAVLTLEDAIELARRNNPMYLAEEARSATADWAVREAYGALLPGANVSTSFGWQDAGTPRFGIFNANDLGLATSTDYYSSSYSVGLTYRLSGATLFAPGREKAMRRQTEASIEVASTGLTRDVTTAYLAVLRAREGVNLARQELERARENLKLAQGRVAAGLAIAIDAKQAEVEQGRAQVALLQAENDMQIQRLNLSELIGVRLDPSTELTTEFTVTEVPWDLEQLVTIALQSHPQIRSVRATVQANHASVRMARSAYFPSLSLSAGFSGFTRQAGNEDYLVRQARTQMENQRNSCELFNTISSGLSQPLPGRPADCSAFVLTPADEAAILASNKVFPFDFSKEPLSVSLTLSLPIFTGFSRERQIEEARLQAKNAEYTLRAEELRRRTQVETAYLALATARQTWELETRNRELAEEQLRLAQERYRVGATSFIELQDAETIKARADRAWLDAVYSFHTSLAQLQDAVGRPLRTAGDN